MFSLSEVSRRLGVPYYRIAYLHASGKQREPRRFMGKRVYSEQDVAEIAAQLGVQTGRGPDKGEPCTDSSTPQ